MLDTRPRFVATYPGAEQIALLSVPERVDPSPEYNGRGITLAFVDSGFCAHNDLRSRITVHVNAMTGRIREEPTIDRVDVMSWHGLMTSSIAAGNGRSSSWRYRGIARHAQLVLVKVSNPRMHVREADILRGFQWVLENHERYNIRVLNGSIGGDAVSNDPDHPLHRCVRQLTEAGVTVVVAAGNSGRASMVPPASAPEAITVGGYDDRNSLNRGDWQAYNSNYGTAWDGSTRKPELIAPAGWLPSPLLPETMAYREAHWLGPLLSDTDGSALRKLLRDGYRDMNLSSERVENPKPQLYAYLQARIAEHKLVGKFYQHVDGTSVSAPIVTSVIAQMLEANPDLRPDQIKMLLTATAKPLPMISRQQQGAGALDARAAVKAAQELRLS